MKNKLPLALFFQIAALLLGFILIHGLYVTVVRPRAEAFLAAEQARMQDGGPQEARQNVYVILKDYEQETCLILMFWAVTILSAKGISAFRQRRQLGEDLLRLPEGLPIGPEDVESVMARLAEIPAGRRDFLLPRALSVAIRRFGATRNVQDAATALTSLCELEGERMESELATIRYIAWAIPSVGFIGTVRGIGAALARANEAVAGDITGVTQSLGVAFNSTFIALVISIVLMFFIHQLQLVQERLVIDTESYGDAHLISRLRVHP
jgi:biopolymer transport protein ExbB/TolQ